MRKWFWSIIMAIMGFIVGIWWLREREATTPALKSYDNTPPAPAKPKVVPEADDHDDGPAAATPPEAPQAPAAAAETTPAEGDPVATLPDDLTQINGIGPAFERALNGIGITTYAQLAAQAPADLAARLNARGISADRIERDGWIEQARRLANN